MPKSNLQKQIFKGNTVFLGDQTMTGAVSQTGNQTITGDQTVNGNLICSNAAGTGAGTIKSVAGQALAVSTTISGTTGTAGAAMTVTGAAGAAGATTTAGGAGGAATITAGAGGAKSGTGAAAGGAGAAASLIAGVGGATASSGTDAGGAGGGIVITAAVGGAASAGTGNGGAGGSVVITAGLGGATTGGTAGVNGLIYNRSRNTVYQGAPTAETGVATLTIADMLSGIITITHSTGGTVALTTDIGSAISAGLPSSFAVSDSFDFTVINLSSAAADTATLTAGASGVSIVGAVIIPSAHSTTIVNSSMTFRCRKSASDTYVIYRVG